MRSPSNEIGRPFLILFSPTTPVADFQQCVTSWHTFLLFGGKLIVLIAE
jgi:hypothetical protein